MYLFPVFDLRKSNFKVLPKEGLKVSNPQYLFNLYRFFLTLNMNDLLDEQPISAKNTIHFHWWVILIWSFVLTTGFLFRIMHWPGSSLFQVIGFGGFMAYSFSFFVLARPRSISIIICNCISLLWVLILICGELFNDGYPFNINGIIAQGISFAFLFIIHIISLYFIKKSRT